MPNPLQIPGSKARDLPVARSEADQLRAIGYALDEDPSPPTNGTGDNRPTPLATDLAALDVQLRAKRARPEEEPGMMERMMSMLGMGP